MFDRDPTLVYRRSPREVRVNQPWGLAEELGVYAAKWQRAEGGEWLLQAEVFTTLDCRGPESGCVRPNPIRSGRRPNDEARRQHGTEVKMQQIGRTLLLDYGALQIRVRYLSDSKLAWEQIKGPAVGLKAEEEYGLAVIRPDAYFIWWQEKDASVVSQVVDFEKGLVHSTWLSPEKQLASFHGTLTPKDS